MKSDKVEVRGRRQRLRLSIVPMATVCLSIDG